MDDLFRKIVKLLASVSQVVDLSPARDKYLYDCKSYKGHIRAFNIHK